MTVVTSREFNRDPSAAKRAAAEGPVTITDRGRPAYVLLSVADYERLHLDGNDLVSRLSMDDDTEFDPEPISIGLRVPEL